MKQGNIEALSTEELFKMIQSSPEQFADRIKNDKDFEGEVTVGKFLEHILKKYGISTSDLIKRSLLSKSFVYQILSDERNPGRDILLRIALAIPLTVDEVQHLLLIAQKGALYPKVRRDAALICCMERKLSLDETDEFLRSIGEKELL